MTVRDTLRKLAPVVGTAHAARLWRMYLASDCKARREVEGMFEAYAAFALDDVPSGGAVGLFPPPPPETCLGEITLGQVRYAGKDSFLFGLRKEELLRHVGIYGSSGCGKSNAIALILDGLMSLKTPFLLCDFKRTFRALLKEHSDVIVFTAGDNDTGPFAFNPLIPPPGTGTEVWSKKIVGALSHAYCQGAGSESLLVSALNDTYLAAQERNRWPSFRDVAEILEAEPARGRKGMWMDSARRSVKSISTGNSGEVFCPEISIDMLTLLRVPVILEMDLLNQAEQTFLAEALILWIIQYRMNDSAARECLRHAIVIEEAHHLLRSPPGVGDGSEPVIHIALREVRELGESVILATQNASVVPVAVFGNQATTLAFHTKHQRDVSSTAQAMLLKDEAKDELGRLPVGEAIVRVPRWPDPVHIRLEYRPIDKGSVSDRDIRQQARNRPCSSDSRRFRDPLTAVSACGPVPRPEDNQIEPVESPSTQAHAVNATRASPTTTPQKNPAKETLQDEPSRLEMEMLRDIVQNPFDGVVKRIKRLGTSRRKGTAALQSLEARSLVQPVPLFTGTSVLKLFDLSFAGRGLCKSRGCGPLPKPTEGGIEHRFHLQQVADALLAQGWKAHKEYSISTDLVVDIHAERDGHILAVLVETGRSDVAGNLVKTAEAGYRHILVVTNSPQVKSRVARAQAGLPPITEVSVLPPHAVDVYIALPGAPGGRVG